MTGGGVVPGVRMMVDGFGPWVLGADERAGGRWDGGRTAGRLGVRITAPRRLNGLVAGASTSATSTSSTSITSASSSAGAASSSAGAALSCSCVGARGLASASAASASIACVGTGCDTVASLRGRQAAAGRGGGRCAP